MNFLHLFSNAEKPEGNEAITLPLQVVNVDSAEESVKNEPETKSDADEKGTLTVTYATGWPIDVIYGYLRKDYSEQGYNDAMVKSDLTFRDMNLRIIKNKILMTFRETNLKYNIMDRSLDTKIQTCAEAGLLSSVAELEQQKAIIETHKVELKQLEENFINGDKNTTISLQSYECGFLRGIATVTLGSIGSNNASLNNLQKRNSLDSAIA